MEYYNLRNCVYLWSIKFKTLLKTLTRTELVLCCSLLIYNAVKFLKNVMKLNSNQKWESPFSPSNKLMNGNKQPVSITNLISCLSCSVPIYGIGYFLFYLFWLLFLSISALCHPVIDANCLIWNCIYIYNSRYHFSSAFLFNSCN